MRVVIREGRHTVAKAVVVDRGRLFQKFCFVKEMEASYYKNCIVPRCSSTSLLTPNKLFIRVPNNEKLRREWLNMARRADAHCLSTTSRMYFCEDHFDIENDMENYVKYKLVGGRLKLKQGIVPHIFKCQEDNEDRPLCSAVKKRGRIQRVKKLLIKDEPQTLDVTVDPGDMLACCLYEPGLEDSSSSANTDQLLEAPNKINTGVEKSHEGSATPSEDSEVEIQRLAKKLTAALTTISVLTKKNGDLTKKNQELSKKVAALEQKNKLMGRQQAVLQKLNEGLARRSLLVEQRSERLRACIVAHGITDAVIDDDEGEEEEPRLPPDTHPHPESDTEETETADEDWAMSQDSSPEQTGTTSKIRPKPLNDLLRVSHQKNVKIVNVLAKSKRRMPRKATNTTLGKRSRHNSVTSKNSRIETCVEPLVETSCVGSEQADPLSLMTPDEIKIEDDIKIEEPDIEEYIAATKQI